MREVICLDGGHAIIVSLRDFLVTLQNQAAVGIMPWREDNGHRPDWKRRAKGLPKN